MTLNRFAGFAWFVVIYNIAVILWGAFVRATGSGAGCGSHWPLCNGEVVPLNPTLERTIEFVHRGMSGIALLLVLGMVIWAFRAYPPGRVRYGAVASGIFIVIEALIGAALVLFGWVGMDQSVARVISISLHLVNTFLLLAALTLTAWWASGGKALDLRSHPLHTYRMGFALVMLMFIAAAGALTALGDTLFPASSLAAGIQRDLNPTAHFLEQLRVAHPLLAVFGGTYLLYLTVMVNGRRGSLTRKLAMTFRFLVVGQILAGTVNIALLAPTWMQLVHLFFADLLWIILVLYSASLLATERATAQSSPLSQRPLRAPAQ
jgi:heme A synthase